MSADVARGHGGDGGGDDHPPPHESAGGCRGKGTRKPNLGGRKAGRMHTRKETRNLGLRMITDELGPQPIRFEWKDNGTMLPLGDHSAHWANLLGEIVREFPMHFGSWRSIPPERKAGVLGKIGTQFDLQPHMQSELWPDIRKGIDQHLGKIYTDNKSSLKRDYWVKNPDDETYDVEAIRSRRPANISAEDWDEQIRFWSDPKNMARCAQNARNRAKSTVVCRQGSRTLAALRDMQSSATQEYPSLIQTFFDTHTVGGVFLRDEDRRLYEEMIDDLKDLWAKPGVETIDVVTGQKFNIRAMFLWTIIDFPTRSSLSGWSGQGYKAYPTCNEDTPSTRVLGKTAYVGHRRFLKKPYKWRRSLDFNGEIKNRDPPPKFNQDDIMTQLARLPMRVKGKHLMYGGVKIKRNVLVEPNGSKRSIFYELEYWSFLTLKHNLDVMHIKKNVLESILNTFLINDKSKDTQARQTLKWMAFEVAYGSTKTKTRSAHEALSCLFFHTRGQEKSFVSSSMELKLPDGS
ncbi:zinc finger, PHD-type containing protein [Tanacetum coccineum]